nr:polysaccharide biosynthesis C-terminal domain-containing protein [Motilibacter deserti]
MGIVARGGSWNALGQLLPVVVNIVLTPYVIHDLGVERFGLWALLLSVTMLLASFDGGIAPSAQRYFSIYAGRDDSDATTRLFTSLFVLLVSVGSVLFLALLLLGPQLLELLDVPAELHDEGAFVARMMSLVVVFGLLRQLFSAVLTSHGRFATPSLANVAGYVAYACGAVVTITAGFGLRGLVCGLVAQNALSTLLLVPGAMRSLSRSGVALLPRSELWDYLKYASRVQVVGLIGIINTQADALITAAFLSVRHVGLLSAGANFGNQLRYVPVNALVPIATLLGQAYGEKGEVESHEDFRRLQRLWVIGSTGWSVVALVAVYFGVSAWLGEGYQTSAVVATIVVAGHGVNLWTGVTTLWLGIIGRPELEVRYAVISVTLNVLLTLALVVPAGVVGVVTATAVGQALSSLYLLRIVRRNLDHPVRSFLRDIPVLPALAAALTGLALELAVRPVTPTGPLGLVVCGVAAAPAFVVYALLAVGPRTALAMVRSRGRAAA